jgi:hypothetical protein
MDNHEKEMKKLRKQLDKQQKETYKWYDYTKY